MERFIQLASSQLNGSATLTGHTMSDAVRDKISSNLKSFDLYALVELLHYYGFDHSSIRVEGHIGFESQPSLINSIRFDKSAHQVTIGLYMGLASANGYLPSYFFSMLDNDVLDESHFQDLIGFFDQHLLKEWLGSLMPQTYVRLSRSKWLRTMASFTSLGHLHHIFEIVFPELQIRCERLEIDQAVESKPCVLGVSKIGFEMILGDQFNIMGYLHRVTLIADDDDIGVGQPWHLCATDRLHEYIFPLIRNMDLFVEVDLLVRGSKKWLSLEQDRITLGFDRFKGLEDHFKIIVLHYGNIPNQ